MIGETAVVEDGVSMLHGVTLGGTGKERGDRHPKVRRGVLLGAGAKVLGNIEIGACAKIAAGSVVLEPVPAGCTAAGVPARIIGCVDVPEPALEMDQTDLGAAEVGRLGDRPDLRHQPAHQQADEAAEQHFCDLVQAVPRRRSAGVGGQSCSDHDGCRDRRLPPHRRDVDDVRRNERPSTASASGSFHSRRSADDHEESGRRAQPTSTLMMRLLNMRTASFTWGSDAAIIEAMAQIGLVSAMFASAVPDDGGSDEHVQGKPDPDDVAPEPCRSHFVCWASGMVRPSETRAEYSPPSRFV